MSMTSFCASCVVWLENAVAPKRQTVIAHGAANAGQLTGKGRQHKRGGAVYGQFFFAARDILDLELLTGTTAALLQLWLLGVVKLTHAEF